MGAAAQGFDSSVLRLWCSRFGVSGVLIQAGPASEIEVRNTPSTKLTCTCLRVKRSVMFSVQELGFRHLGLGFRM